jgi:preprotein translocase subunit SecG
MLIYYLVTALHVLVCVILILVVLLQSGKGADLAGAFGGGATQTAFGSRGPASFLSKLTTAAAVLFMLTCLSLSLMGERHQEKSILDDTKGKSAPAKTSAPAAAQPAPRAPTPDQIKKIQEEIEAKQKQAPAGTQTAPAPAEKPQPLSAKPADAKAPSQPAPQKP